MNITITCGRENRHYYLDRIVRITRDHVDAIHIIDTGSTDKTETLSDYDKVNYVRVNNWKNDFDQLMSVMIEQVPNGEWLLHLDSDEIPTQALVSNMNDCIDTLESRGRNCGFVPNVPHWEGEAASWNDPYMPQSHEEWEKKPVWCKGAIHRKDADLKPSSLGAHHGPIRDVLSFEYIGPYCYNHMKNHGQLANSVVMHSILFLDTFDVEPGSEDYLIIDGFREKYNIEATNEFISMIELGEREFIRDLEEMCLSFKGCEENTIGRHYFDWCFRHNFTYRPSRIHCSHECCKYDNPI